MRNQEFPGWDVIVSRMFPISFRKPAEWSLEHISITEEWPKDRRFENFTLYQESAALYMIMTEILSTYLYTCQRFFR